MDELIDLLERKNLCFRSFYKLCADFVDEIAKGDTKNLEEFQRRRQNLIRVLEQLEFEVVHWLESNSQTGDCMTASIKDRVALLLREKDGVVQSILDLDLQILAHIDRIKDDTIQRLQSLQSGRRTLNAYKSPLEQVESAENNKALDREA